MTGARDLLFELGTEELPPKNLLTLSSALTEGVLRGLREAGIAHGPAYGYATPRRLAVRIDACAASAQERRIERRGPPLASAFDPDGAPTPAAAAFARSCGVAVSELGRLTTDKGAWLAFHGIEPGAATSTLLGTLINQAIVGLPIARRMRWGEHSVEFVRPVRTLVLLFGEDVVPIEVLGLKSDRLSLGHRFHAPRPIRLKSAQTYERQLKSAKVIADFGRRRDVVRAGVLAAGVEAGGTALIESDLLDEVTALVEWPVPIAGRFDERFLALPREVVIATIQEHQRYFAVETVEGRLNGAFVTVSNLDSRDPVKVREGNERVVRPRLSDAAFFWDQDRSVTLDVHAEKLARVVFQAQLGSYADKTARIKKLAEWMAGRISAGPDVGRAADLAKADLMTAMVSEFPELQGTMGRYYAEAQGEPADVARALEEHYLPRFANDAVPQTTMGQALALADKSDTLTGIFAIGQRPSGTKDPFGLRRAALGILRILLEQRLDLSLHDLLREAAQNQPVQRAGVADEVYDFMAERLRGLLFERTGMLPDRIDAVLSGRPHSPLDAEARLRALNEFLVLPEAGALTALNKRIANLLRKAPPGAQAVQAGILVAAAEVRLHQLLESLRDTVERALAERRYPDALHASSTLGGAADDFFANVMVMDEDAQRRENRLALLRGVQHLLGGVADLSRLTG